MCYQKGDFLEAKFLIDRFIDENDMFHSKANY